MLKLAQAILVMIAVLGAISLGAWGAMQIEISAKPLAPIADRLPENFVNGERAFKARVRARYADVRSETELISDLVGQGFTLKDVSGHRFAELTRWNGCGDTVWRIWWRADNVGHLAEVSGQYGTICL